MDESEITEKVRKYFAEEGLVDRSDLDLFPSLEKGLGQTEAELIDEKIAKGHNGDEGQMQMYDALSKCVDGVCVYDFFKSGQHAMSSWRLSQLYLHLQRANARSILDIGCASGLEACFVAENISNCNVIGIDISKKILDVAKGRATRRDLTNLSFTEANRDQIPFPDNSFDAVSYLNCLVEGGDGDIFSAIYGNTISERLGEARRVVRVGGDLVLMLHTDSYNADFALNEISRKIKSVGMEMKDTYYKNYEHKILGDSAALVFVAEKKN